MEEAEAVEMDDDQSAGGDACFLAKEQSWRTAWRTRSLLSRTIRSGAARGPQLRNRAIAMRRGCRTDSAWRLSTVGNSNYGRFQGVRMTTECGEDATLGGAVGDRYTAEPLSDSLVEKQEPGRALPLARPEGGLWFGRGYPRAFPTDAEAGARGITGAIGRNSEACPELAASSLGLDDWPRCGRLS
jgi:hypothetical protein